MGVAIVVALAGIAAAVSVYGKKKVKAVEPEILANGWFYDRLVSNFMGGPGRRAFDAVAWTDANVIDGAVRGTGVAVRSTSGVVRRVQSGFVRAYAAIIAIAVILMLVWFVYRGVA
jgi:NADH-quinone oxidoreductase subunit L